MPEEKKCFFMVSIELLMLFVGVGVVVVVVVVVIVGINGEVLAVCQDMQTL